MKKKLIIAIAVIVAALVLGVVVYTIHHCEQKKEYRTNGEERALKYCQLDHDIYVSPDTTVTICNETITGWSPSCGPSPAGWPMAFPYKWEVMLCESNNFYFARLIYHEYVLWLSFDYPYVLCKIPKIRTTGDWATNTAARYNALWDITNQFEHGYNKPKTIKEPQIYSINGHHVSFGNDTFEYNQYVVVHDTEYPW
jgi:hypothetical protein